MKKVMGVAALGIFLMSYAALGAAEGPMEKFADKMIDKLDKNCQTEFETYCQKELNIRNTTASKLIRSYSFLEKEEPRIVKPDFTEGETPKKIPDYEAVNLLRLAKNNKTIPANEFAELRNDVLNEGKEPKEVRAAVKKILETHAPKETPEMKDQKRGSILRRLIGFLNSAKSQLEEEDLVPDYLLKQIDTLTQKLEDQLN